MESSGRLNRRAPYDPSGVVARKAPNYLAQRLGRYSQSSPARENSTISARR